MCAAPAAGARPWKKNSRASPPSKPLQAPARYPLDPPHHREDRNRTRHPRHPGLSQDRRPHPQGPRRAGCASTTSASRQAPAHRDQQFQCRAARPIRPTRPADRQHRYQKARTNRQLQAKAPLGNDLHKPSTTTTSAPSRRHRHPLRRLRPERQSRLRRHLPRHRCGQWWQRDGLERYRDASDCWCSPTPAANAPHPLLQVCTPDAPATRTTSRSPRHYPIGASKWNPIDHRLFSEISKNWAGHPLRSYQTILNHIRTTTTDTGLCVTAQLVAPKGVKISDAQFASIALQPHQVQPAQLHHLDERQNRHFTILRSA